MKNINEKIRIQINPHLWSDHHPTYSTQIKPYLDIRLNSQIGAHLRTHIYLQFKQQLERGLHITIRDEKYNYINFNRF